jgi:thiamine kinase-like enzyme
MKTAAYQEALDAYGNPFHEFVVEPITGGLINQSYKVTSKVSGGSFLLQQINTRIFSEPEKLQTNYDHLWKYLEEEEINFRMPEPKLFPGDNTLFSDSHENYWRVFEYMDGTRTLEAAENEAQARAVAETFAGFTASFENYDTENMYIPIPGFHNLSLRFRQFQESLKHADFEKLLKAAPLVNELRERERYANLYDVLTESEEFHQRVMHHDAKISNVLFDEDSDIIICPVDFDTVMPGYIFSDLGDMIRSMTASVSENSNNTDGLEIRKEYYEAIVDGYLDILGDQFTSPEKKYIHFSGLVMIYMQALRFLTDYLKGNIYYQTSYPDQNLDRAINQSMALKKLEEFLADTYQFKV